MLEPVYEQDFLECSYGFRPGRGAHQALEALWKGLMNLGGGWVIDLDIEDFFGSVDWGHLRSFLDRRVRDGVVRRAIGKWLNAGVMEAGELSYPQRGTPQGGVVSPTLSNVYLHEVLDLWFEHEVKPRLRGRAFEVRYADDAVLVFEHEDDARRVLGVLAKRLEKYGLRLHPDKTRMVEFCRPSKSTRGGSQRERSFVMLGFTHYWGRSRKGRWVVKRKTAKDRFSRALRGFGQWCRNHRHWKLRDQQAVLSRKLRGHYAYYGITGNAAALSRLRTEVIGLWRKWLGRRRLERAHVMGTIHAPSQYLPPPTRARGAQCVSLSSEPIVRRAVCLNWARTDPREPRVGNCPRPPGHVEHVAGGEGDVAQAVQARMQHGGDVSAHGGFS